MIFNRRVFLSLRELKESGNNGIAEAHAAIGDARRLAREAAELRAAAQLIHDQLNGPGPEPLAKR